MGSGYLCRAFVRACRRTAGLNVSSGPLREHGPTPLYLSTQSATISQSVRFDLYVPDAEMFADAGVSCGSVVILRRGKIMV